MFVPYVQKSNSSLLWMNLYIYYIKTFRPLFKTHSVWFIDIICNRIQNRMLNTNWIFSFQPKPHKPQLVKVWIGSLIRHKNCYCHFPLNISLFSARQRTQIFVMRQPIPPDLRDNSTTIHLVWNCYRVWIFIVIFTSKQRSTIVSCSIERLRTL